MSSTCPAHNQHWVYSCYATGSEYSACYTQTHFFLSLQMAQSFETAMMSAQTHLYRCLNCNFKGRQQETIKHVLRFHLPDEMAPFLCTICPLKMMARYFAVNHMKREHPGVTFQEGVKGKGDRLTAYRLKDYMRPVSSGLGEGTSQDPLGLETNRDRRLAREQPKEAKEGSPLFAEGTRGDGPVCPFYEFMSSLDEALMPGACSEEEDFLNDDKFGEHDCLLVDPEAPEEVSQSPAMPASSSPALTKSNGTPVSEEPAVASPCATPVPTPAAPRVPSTEQQADTMRQFRALVRDEIAQYTTELRQKTTPATPQTPEMLQLTLLNALEEHNRLLRAQRDATLQLTNAIEDLTDKLE